MNTSLSDYADRIIFISKYPKDENPLLFFSVKFEEDICAPIKIFNFVKFPMLKE
jgi:hypothetical protein